MLNTCKQGLAASTLDFAATDFLFHFFSFYLLLLSPEATRLSLLAANLLANIAASTATICVVASNLFFWNEIHKYLSLRNSFLLFSTAECTDLQPQNLQNCTQKQYASTNICGCNSQIVAANNGQSGRRFGSLG